MDIGNNTSAATSSHLSASRALPANVFARPALLTLAVMLFVAAWLLGGVEAATILLAVLIGGLALSRPRSALWASTAFLIYLFVFFQGEHLVGPTLPPEFIWWGAGVAIITSALILAWIRLRHRALFSRRLPILARFDRMMLLMLSVSLLASGYGLLRGNNWFAVARQLFGCLLLPGYYLFARTFFRGAVDIHHWLGRVSAVVTAGAAWYAVKLTFLSISEGAYTPEQSPLSFFAGAIGAVLFAKLLWEREGKKRILIVASLLSCLLAILLTGARFVAGSLVGTAVIILILRQRKHRLLMGLAIVALVALGVSFAIAHLGDAIQRGGLVGGIGARFSPLNVDEDLSMVGRMAQMASIVDIVRQHPVFGVGMGAEYSFFAPGFFEQFGSTVYVDNGWGFLLLKMGLVGLLVFVGMLWTFLKFAAGSALCSGNVAIRGVQGCLLALLLFGVLSFIGGPTFFEFLMSGLMGTTLGALAALAASSSHAVHPGPPAGSQNPVLTITGGSQA